MTEVLFSNDGARHRSAPVTPRLRETCLAPTPISIETKRTPEKTPEAAVGNARLPPPASTQPPAPKTRRNNRQFGKFRASFITPRKAERVSMTGTNAYAVLGEQGARRAKVLDLGFGGVALELDSSEGLTENILAVLHVPILPPVRVNLKPVWTQRTDLGGFRVGCTFVS